MVFSIISKDYDHFNRSLGMRITSKKQYHEELKKRGMIDAEKAFAQADLVNEKRNNPKMELSQKAKDIISTARMKADRKGRIKCDDRLVDAMKDVGVKFNRQLPKHYQVGGFE
jgi:hypothetical protein